MDKTELFHNLVNLAAVDNKFAEEEIDFLVDRANRWDIPNEEMEKAMARISEGEIEIKLPEADEDRVELLKEMLRLVAVDGEVAEMEKRLCAQASARMDFTGNQFRKLLEEVLAEVQA